MKTVMENLIFPILLLTTKNYRYMVLLKKTKLNDEISYLGRVLDGTITIQKGKVITYT